MTKAKPLFYFTEMASCYVVFYGKTPEIYLTWHECSKQVLGIKNAIYKKYSGYEQAVRDFHALVRDVNASLGAAAPLPYDPIPQDAFAQSIAPSDGYGKAGWTMDKGGQYWALRLPHLGL